MKQQNYFKDAEAFKARYGYYPDDMPDDMDSSANDVTTSKDLVITFIRTDNSNYNMTIPDYKDGISDQDIADGAKAILSGNIFSPGGLDFIRVDHAKRVDKTVTEVPIV